jgi:hypothetical protein
MLDLLMALAAQALQHVWQGLAAMTIDIDQAKRCVLPITIFLARRQGIRIKRMRQ